MRAFLICLFALKVAAQSEVTISNTTVSTTSKKLSYVEERELDRNQIYESLSSLPTIQPSKVNHNMHGGFDDDDTLVYAATLTDHGFNVFATSNRRTLQMLHHSFFNKTDYPFKITRTSITLHKEARNFSENFVVLPLPWDEVNDGPQFQLLGSDDTDMIDDPAVEDSNLNAFSLTCIEVVHGTVKLEGAYFDELLDHDFSTADLLCVLPLVFNESSVISAIYSSNIVPPVLLNYAAIFDSEKIYQRASNPTLKMYPHWRHLFDDFHGISHFCMGQTFKPVCHRGEGPPKLGLNSFGKWVYENLPDVWFYAYENKPTMFYLLVCLVVFAAFLGVIAVALIILALCKAIRKGDARGVNASGRQLLSLTKACVDVDSDGSDNDDEDGGNDDDEWQGEQEDADEGEAPAYHASFSYQQPHRNRSLPSFWANAPTEPPPGLYPTGGGSQPQMFMMMVPMSFSNNNQPGAIMVPQPVGVYPCPPMLYPGTVGADQQFPMPTVSPTSLPPMNQIPNPIGMEILVQTKIDSKNETTC